MTTPSSTPNDSSSCEKRESEHGKPGHGKVAVITGASRGIGAALAAAFARVGYTVEASSRQGGTPDGEPYRVTALDVTDAQAVRRHVYDVHRAHGRIDVLVNNAGVIDDEVPIQDSDPEQWWRTVEVNVRGPYLLTRYVLPHMLEAGSGRIVNMNSGAGTRANANTSAYYVGKSALGRVTGAVHQAAQQAGREVFAFDLAPGVVHTDMTRSMPVHKDRSEWTAPERVVELALALASGRLDSWSGRMVRAGTDTVESLLEVAESGFPEDARTVGLKGYGPTDPVV